MKFFLFNFLSILLIQVNIHMNEAGVEHLRQEDQKCFPFDFDYQLEEQYFVRLLVIPYLDIESIRDLSKLNVVPENNARYNDFLSCMWRSRGFQYSSGRINFNAIEDVLGRAIGREVGDTGPGNNLGKLEASRIISECNDLEGDSQERTVMLVRNCVLVRIKKFGRL